MKMTKKASLSVLLIGILLLIVSAVMTVVPASRASIIGGAGWPTLMFYFHTTGADWLAFIGVPVTVIAAVMLLRKR